MFTTLISDLQQGHFPDPVSLRGRLHAALVKKLAMLRLEIQFRHQDEKINPNANHMLWAALLLEDNESIAIIIDILLTEALDQAQARRGAKNRQPILDQQKIFQQSCTTLLQLVTNPILVKQLQQKIKKVTDYS